MVIYTMEGRIYKLQSFDSIDTLIRLTSGYITLMGFVKRIYFLEFQYSTAQRRNKWNYLNVIQESHVLYKIRLIKKCNSKKKKIWTTNITVRHRVAHIFKKSRCHLRLLGARRVIRRNFHTEGPQILGATVNNLAATMTWRPEFVHPWFKILITLLWNTFYHAIFKKPAKYAVYRETLQLSLNNLLHVSAHVQHYQGVSSR
jgi:hypothetical protein